MKKIQFVHLILLFAVANLALWAVCAMPLHLGAIASYVFLVTIVLSLFFFRYISKKEKVYEIIEVNHRGDIYFKVRRYFIVKGIEISQFAMDSKYYLRFNNVAEAEEWIARDKKRFDVITEKVVKKL